MIGSIAENTFRNVHADFAVFSARSLTGDEKIYDTHYNETPVRNVMFENSDKKIFLCDNSKINTISPYYQCSLTDIDYRISDTSSVKTLNKHFPNLTFL